MNSLIGLGYEQLIIKLVAINKVKAVNLLFYDSCTFVSPVWQDLALSVKQLKIRVTTFPAREHNIITLSQPSLKNFVISDCPIRKNMTLGLFSLLLDSQNKHKYWLMLDFSASVNRKNLAKIKMYTKSLLKILGIKKGGFLIETDNSYHFLGSKPVKKTVFADFLKMAIKSNGGDGLADVGFCAHALDKDMKVCLRIQKRPNGKELRIVAKV